MTSDEDIAREIQSEMTEKGIRGIATRSQIGGIMIAVPKRENMTPEQSAYIDGVVCYQTQKGRRVDLREFK
ncbi:MAG: hypothetical protein WCO23_03460 [bacterium]